MIDRESMDRERLKTGKGRRSGGGVDDGGEKVRWGLEIGGLDLEATGERGEGWGGRLDGVGSRGKKKNYEIGRAHV